MPGASGGGQVPLSSVARVESAHRAAINHGGQFPAVTHLVQPRARRRRSAQAVDAIEAAQREIGMPASIQTHFQGAARAFRVARSTTSCC